MMRVVGLCSQPMRAALMTIDKSLVGLPRPGCLLPPLLLQQQQQWQKRSVWSTGTDPEARVPSSKSRHALTPFEITKVASLVKKKYSIDHDIRFVAISLDECKLDGRHAEVIVLNSVTGIASEVNVTLSSSDNNSEPTISSSVDLRPDQQPLLTPDDCNLAEYIAKSSPAVQAALKERYGITDMSRIAADPWSVNLASENDVQMAKNRRLVQTFLYQRVYGTDMQDNQYAHPINILPVVDLISKTVVHIDGLDQNPPPEIPQASVNYHRDLVSTNDYLPKSWRDPPLTPLNIVQPNGPSFQVSDTNLVEWANWSFRVGFNYREGLVLHDVHFGGRSVVKRASLVEMAVPYGDPRDPWTRKCAFDVGDYGLGYCANSLELGCDCLGHIHYFDAALCDFSGSPKLTKKAICMHEEDTGLLWKHVEYRNGHNEARRSRELVLSMICTVVNYEYLFYWRFKLDGTLELEIKLSGELSVNLLSPDEQKDGIPTHGVLVAPKVNAQVHQHLFCARLDMAVDGPNNSISEVDFVSLPSSLGNGFGIQETLLQNEQEAVRVCDSAKARCWKIFNPTSTNPISKMPVAYKLIPFTRGPAAPTLLTDPNKCTINSKGAFAEANIWVTPFHPKQRFPAGEYVPQQAVRDGLPQWIEQGRRSIQDTQLVVWHAFGVTHVPRVEDFPVMPCESTGFTLKPDGFSNGNPAIDLPPDANKASALAKGCCAKK